MRVVLCASTAYRALALPLDQAPAARDLKDPSGGAQYVISIDTAAAFAEEPPPHGQRVPMLDSQGRGFTCYLPHMQQNDTEREATLEASASPADLLESLSGKCFYRAEEWWNYEVCYKKHVKQFHTEGETTMDEYSLGSYDEAATDLNNVQETSGDSTGPSTYVSSQYSRGEACDLVNGHRSAEVIYSCAPPDALDQILSVKEVSTCSYLLHIATQHLCTHPGLNRAPSQTTKITCLRQKAHHHQSVGSQASALCSKVLPSARPPYRDWKHGSIRSLRTEPSNNAAAQLLR
ncbi:hypothetical protein WJX84_007782 [Apatococcus fuscideae]|uniref:MRH domain-containing protein n=1 Tax=Apatococcus fuscideae TaxID=2026836 RepID=A0AAW1S0E7_9CHLO